MAPKPRTTSKKHIARLERERRQVRLIQYVTIGVVAAIALILAYGYIDINFLQARRPVAEVNGEAITVKEFQGRVVLQRNQALSNYMQYFQFSQQFGMDLSSQLQQIELSLSSPVIIGQETLDAMIDEALIRQEAARRGITMSDEELEAFTYEQFGYFPDGTPVPTVTPTEVTITYPTPSSEQLELVTATPVPTEGPTVTPIPTVTVETSPTPEASPTSQPTPLPSPTATPYTLAGFQSEYDRVLSSMEEFGISKEHYRKLLETEYLRKLLFEDVAKDVPSGEQEQVWARHILVADEEAAKELIARLEAGEDFGALASELSIDPGSGSLGGDLGWFSREQMVPPFSAAAFSLDEGEISEPVQSDFGWHVIQTLGHTTIPMTAQAYEQARQAAFEELLESLREAAEITTYDELWREIVPTSPGLEELQGMFQ